MQNYGDPQYWERRYEEQEGRTFDWLEDYQALSGLIAELAPSYSSKVLVLGCGNAEFSEQMYDSGYLNIINIDISTTVIHQMQERNTHRVAMQYLIGDVRKLNFPNDEFDLVIDKSTMDALLCGDQAYLDVAKMTREVQRVLKVTGNYLSISYGKPETRTFHFTLPHLNWTFRTQEIRGNEEEDEEDSVHYCYICTKVVQWQEAAAMWEEVQADLIVPDLGEVDFK